MYFILANHISRQFNDALRQLFIELVASIEGIIGDLYWMPDQQRKHLLTELTGLRMQLEWEDSGHTFTDHSREINDDYFSNMLVMIRYKTSQFLSGKPSHVITEHHSSTVALVNKMIGMPIDLTSLNLKMR